MLNITGLRKRYPNGVQALSDVDLTIPRGMYGLLGPNGAGKSTLMRILATLQQPDSGAVEFDDIDVLATPDRLRAVLGYLPQDFGVYPRLTPLAMLDHIALLKGIGTRHARDHEVRRLLTLTNLWEVRSRRLDTFSGGMRQRFGIAQALIGKPQLLIVDEPTAGLDPSERQRFNRLLAQLSQDIVVLLSTHIVDDVADLCTQMAILGSGKVLIQGSPRTLTEQLRGRLWQREVTFDELPRLDGVVSTQLSAGRLRARMMTDQPPDGAIAAEATLEDVYFSTLTQHSIKADA